MGAGSTSPTSGSPRAQPEADATSAVANRAAVTTRMDTFWPIRIVLRVLDPPTARPLL
ncbi:hypothetical protein FBY28_1238 [Arthrobacter sp. SLBN-53]|nr:hypothetical protein FBY28_1238 [Arthrobacter sp. SLBN-53]